MEDLLILLLQGLAQLLFEIFAYLPWDVFWYSDSITSNERDSYSWVGPITSILMGALVGWISLYFFPDTLIRLGWVRILLLVVSPIFSGLIALQFAKLRQEKNPQVDPWFHFWIGLCFSVGLVWVRFTLAHRPA